MVISSGVVVLSAMTRASRAGLRSPMRTGPQLQVGRCPDDSAKPGTHPRAYMAGVPTMRACAHVALTCKLRRSAKRTREVTMSTAPIVCGVDDSRDGHAAVVAAAALSARIGAPLVAVHVASDP